MKAFHQIVNALSLLLAFTAGAQTTGKTTYKMPQATLLLPDGRVLDPGKLDSLYKVWGDGRVSFMHSREDDEKGIVRVIRVTDEMIQQQLDREHKQKLAFAAMLDNPAPDFELKDMQGNRWSLQELRGKVVVLNFWFTSCAPCIQEMPALNKLVQSYNGKEVVFLALAFNDAKQVNTFLQTHSFNYTILPGSGEVDKKYNISSWPTSIVIDKEGNIKKIMNSSPKVREELEAVINTLK
ncbi:MAG: TlpA family protein disulfide reductase [Niastella sp.]|nr:TlpA family protein disulfide reductase [Niastella sp.]